MRAHIWNFGCCSGNIQEEPGAVVCRVAHSWIRFGSFQLPAALEETPLVKQLADYVIKHHYSHLEGMMSKDNFAPPHHQSTITSAFKIEITVYTLLHYVTTHQYCYLHRGILGKPWPSFGKHAQGCNLATIPFSTCSKHTVSPCSRTVGCLLVPVSDTWGADRTYIMLLSHDPMKLGYGKTSPFWQMAIK